MTMTAEYSQIDLPHHTTDMMWRAVQLRDALSDGAFVYAVKSTGIYCRPSCGSRRPGSVAAVEFFQTADEAEDTGYRACLRCRPAEPNMWQPDLAVVQRACRILEEQNTRVPAISLPGLAEKLGGISSFHLQKTFKRVLGVSPKEYQNAVRLRQFRAMLREGELVGVAARKAGYRSPGTLYGPPNIDLGIAPAEYKAGGAGLRIDYTSVECPLGWMLLAATDRGVCSIKLGENPEALEVELRKEFSRAELKRNPETLAPYLLAALSTLGLDSEASAAAERLPLDVRATAFQCRVWKALRMNPAGNTQTYQETAAALGSSALSRAVGAACASNPVALAVPCHRIVGSDGELRGYRWGLDRKEALLNHEQVLSIEE